MSRRIKNILWIIPSYRGNDIRISRAHQLYEKNGGENPLFFIVTMKCLYTLFHIPFQCMDNAEMNGIRRASDNTYRDHSQRYCH